MKVRKEDYYDINTIDNKTKFIMEEEFMHSRTLKIITDYFKRIKNIIYDQALEQYNKEKQKPVKEESSSLL